MGVSLSDWASTQLQLPLAAAAYRGALATHVAALEAVTPRESFAPCRWLAH